MTSMALPNLASPATLQLDERVERGITLVQVSGELDLTTAPEFCRALVRSVSPAARVRIVLDLRAVRFCDSTGLRALLGAVREVEVRAGSVAIAVAEGGAVDRTLALTGVREFLNVTRSPEDAKRLLHTA